MLRSDYNLLSIHNVPASYTYFDMLPKDVLWFIHGLTKPQDGYVVLCKPFISTVNGVEFVKGTTLHSRETLEALFPMTTVYGPRYFVEKVKFLFIDGQQYAAIPIHKKIDGFTPETPFQYGQRCTAKTLTGKRCKRKIINNVIATSENNVYCATHRQVIR